MRRATIDATCVFICHVIPEKSKTASREPVE
jgi:hypothetical protein